MNRRGFLLAGLAIGGGLGVGYAWFKPRDLLGDRTVLATTAHETALNAWLKIAHDGRVTIAVPRAEMGQGVYTALPMLVAEELDLAWDAIAVEQAPIAPVYASLTALVAALPLDHRDHGWVARAGRATLERAARVLALQVTGGSSSVRDAWLPMRVAGAAARDMLMRAAAARLAVHVNDLDTDQGYVHHASSQRALAYGELAAEAARLTPNPHVPLKPRAAWRVLGRPLPRLDVADKVDGRAQFGIDVRVPDMLYASIRNAPTFGGRVRSVEQTSLAAAPGVAAVVVDEEWVAVVADSWWHAEQALAKAALDFEPADDVLKSTADVFARYQAALDAGESSVYEDLGDVTRALAEGDIVSAQYRVPFLAHACMEPMNCTARITDDRAEIWCGNQAPDLLRLLAADLLGFARDKVTLHTPLLGGGFGRRAEPDVMLRTLAIARQLPGRAVQLIYPRTQDLTHDTYRPAALAQFRARLDANGMVHAWHHRLASPSVTQAVLGRAFPHLPRGGPDRTNVEGAAFLAYEIPHRRVEHANCRVPVPAGYWRSVGHSSNAFFSECFIDELARIAGRDPIEFRLAHLPPASREHRVLRHVRDLSQWADPPAAGHARGVALHESFGSVVGQTADISVVDDAIQVHRVVCVIDCGVVVNPDTVMAQMESGIVFGLSAALYGEAPFADGCIKLDNLPDYRLLSLRECPRIEVHVIAGDDTPGGVGEPGTPPIAPAVANAYAALTGRRLRSLPLSPTIAAEV